MVRSGRLPLTACRQVETAGEDREAGKNPEACQADIAGPDNDVSVNPIRRLGGGGGRRFSSSISSATISIMDA